MVTGDYIVHIDVDPDIGTVWGDPQERIVRCGECSYSRPDGEGDIECPFMGPVDYSDYCSSGRMER